MFRAIILLTKGILRDTRLRRNLMLWTMLVAMVMLFMGSWLMSDQWARQHVWLYFAYWIVCAWLTIAGMLLALFDILIIRAAGRAMRRRIEQDIAHIDARTVNVDARTLHVDARTMHIHIQPEQNETRLGPDDAKTKGETK